MVPSSKGRLMNQLKIDEYQRQLSTRVAIERIDAEMVDDYVCQAEESLNAMQQQAKKDVDNVNPLCYNIPSE